MTEEVGGRKDGGCSKEVRVYLVMVMTTSRHRFWTFVMGTLSFRKQVIGGLLDTYDRFTVASEWA